MPPKRKRQTVTTPTTDKKAKASLGERNEASASSSSISKRITRASVIANEKNNNVVEKPSSTTNVISDVIIQGERGASGHFEEVGKFPDLSIVATTDNNLEPGSGNFEEVGKFPDLPIIATTNNNLESGEDIPRDASGNLEEVGKFPDSSFVATADSNLESGEDIAKLGKGVNTIDEESGKNIGVNKNPECDIELTGGFDDGANIPESGLGAIDLKAVVGATTVRKESGKSLVDKESGKSVEVDKIPGSTLGAPDVETVRGNEEGSVSTDVEKKSENYVEIEKIPESALDATDVETVVGTNIPESGLVSINPGAVVGVTAVTGQVQREVRMRDGLFDEQSGSDTVILSGKFVEFAENPGTPADTSKLLEQNCSTTFLSLTFFMHEEPNSKYVGPRVNHRPISKQFVKILIEGAQSEDPKVSKDWKEEISFMFYELYEADDEQEKKLDWEMYSPVYTTYKTSYAHDGCRRIFNKYAGPVRMKSVKKLLEGLNIQQDFDKFFQDVTLDNKTFVTDVAILSKLITHDVFSKMVFPSLDVFRGIPVLELQLDSWEALTMENAAKNMRLSIKKFQELTNLRVAVVEGQHRAFSAKNMASGYWIGHVNHRATNYKQIQSYVIDTDSVLTRFVNCRVLSNKQGFIQAHQMAEESKRLEVRKREGVEVTWRTWFSARLYDIYTDFLQKADGYIHRIWIDDFITEVEVIISFCLVPEFL
jgi:hypothetical protein